MDKSIEVKDHGRGIPLDYNEGEGRFNWELVYCELYAGGKYDNNKKAECMSTVCVLTVLVRVQHSTAVNIWM